MRLTRDHLTSTRLLPLALMSTIAGAAQGQVVFPTSPGEAITNATPWQTGLPAGITVHQVFASSLFANATGGLPARIDRLPFTGTITAHIALRLGYTHAIPGAPACGGGGLAIPDAAGGGSPNAIGPMQTFFESDVTNLGTGTTSFGMIFLGTPFVYDPSQGNLLLEIYMPTRTSGTGSQNASPSLESSRTYQVHGGAASTPLAAIQATRVEFTFSAVNCYANCDSSSAAPILNANDFQCFLNKFASADTYANCDGSSTDPILNANDFQCFLNAFAAGCT